MAVLVAAGGADAQLNLTAEDRFPDDWEPDGDEIEYAAGSWGDGYWGTEKQLVREMPGPERRLTGRRGRTRPRQREPAPRGAAAAGPQRQGFLENTDFVEGLEWHDGHLAFLSLVVVTKEGAGGGAGSMATLIYS